MISLRAYQEEFKRLVFFRAQEAQDSPLWSGELPKRIHVYRNNSRSNWTDALNCDFPLTRAQFSEQEWDDLSRRYFIAHPPEHWEINAAMSSFVEFLQKQKLKPYVKELADYEWFDLKIFIDRARVEPGSGVTNPTAALRVYQHQIFNWAQDEAPAKQPPAQKPEVLVFFRDSENTCRILEADPLMILFLEHFRKKGAHLHDLENTRRQLLPGNTVPLESALEKLSQQDLILL